MSARLESLKQMLIQERDQAELDLIVARDTVKELEKDVKDLTRDVAALEALGYV